MVNVTDVYGGNYLNASIVKSEKLINKPLTIDSADIVDIGLQNPKPKVVLTFKETDKKLPLNKTNAKIMSENFGDETDEWFGKKIHLQITKRQFQGTIVDAIEVGV
jgi:hypothetical protein